MEINLILANICSEVHKFSQENPPTICMTLDLFYELMPFVYANDIESLRLFGCQIEILANKKGIWWMIGYLKNIN